MCDSTQVSNFHLPSSDPTTLTKCSSADELLLMYQLLHCQPGSIDFHEQKPYCSGPLICRHAPGASWWTYPQALQETRRLAHALRASQYEAVHRDDVLQGAQDGEGYGGELPLEASWTLISPPSRLLLRRHRPRQRLHRVDADIVATSDVARSATAAVCLVGC